MLRKWILVRSSVYYRRQLTFPAPSSKSILTELDLDVETGQRPGLNAGTPGLIQEGIDIECLQYVPLYQFVTSMLTKSQENNTRQVLCRNN